MTVFEPLRDQWTIVILGSWNVSIFNPSWLTLNIFDANEVSLEVPVAPGLPRRVTADNVTLIPSNTNLTLTPTSIDDSNLTNMERIACKVLDILQHTPVSAVGINFGYSVPEPPPNLTSGLPTLYGEELASQDLVLNTREYRWSSTYEQCTLNIYCNVAQNSTTFKFNFHVDVQNAKAALDSIVEKVISYRLKTVSILETAFNLSEGGA